MSCVGLYHTETQGFISLIHEVLVVIADVSKRTEVDSMIQKILERMDRIDILFIPFYDICGKVC